MNSDTHKNLGEKTNKKKIKYNIKVNKANKSNNSKKYIKNKIQNILIELQDNIRKGQEKERENKIYM